MQTQKNKKAKTSQPKKKISYYQRQKAIMEISKEVNKSMTKRYLFDMLFD